MQKRVMIVTILCILIFVPALVFAQNSATRFLCLADFHFDPLLSCTTFPCPLLEKLQKAPVNQWQSILLQYDNAPVDYGQDTNSRLLFSSLYAAKQMADKNQIQFVVVLGDFLGHHFYKKYRQYSQDNSSQRYELFVDKTLQFLTNQLQEAFPNKEIYPVIGNNDSYHGDYRIYPHGKFFQHSSSIWRSLSKNSTFNNTNGYYHTTLPHQPNIHLLVLNSVLFSHKCQGRDIPKAAIEQLDWLHHQLEIINAKQQKAIIVTHIPMTMDFYATKRMRLFTLLQLWHGSYAARFRSELKRFAPSIMGVVVGHLHTDWYHLVSVDHDNEIPMTGAPSVSPIFGNDPSFKIYYYESPTFQIKEFATYNYALHKRTHAWT